MSHINRSALLPFSDQQMFVLVNDIEAYPDYMDGCVGAEVLRNDGAVIEARLDLARGGIKMSFTTRNYLVEPSEMVMELLDGPFSEFEGRWHFKALNEQACKVTLDLTFTLSSKLAGMAARKMFDAVAGNLVDALCKRAKETYGR